ncbi:MAG: hypothetical protein WC359_12535 [Dehalococcoidia bacterium]|jgi:hypothetical protein
MAINPITQEAAQDLYYACRAAVVSLIGDEDYQRFKPVINNLTSAINKAEGKE